MPSMHTHPSPLPPCSSLELDVVGLAHQIQVGVELDRPELVARDSHATAVLGLPIVGTFERDVVQLQARHQAVIQQNHLLEVEVPERVALVLILLQHGGQHASLEAHARLDPEPLGLGIARQIPMHGRVAEALNDGLGVLDVAIVGIGPGRTLVPTHVLPRGRLDTGRRPARAVDVALVSATVDAARHQSHTRQRLGLGLGLQAGLGSERKQVPLDDPRVGHGTARRVTPDHVLQTLGHFVLEMSADDRQQPELIREISQRLHDSPQQRAITL